MDSQSPQARRQYANMQQNVERGLYFLRLATEQARILSPEIAKRLVDYDIPNLASLFDQAITTEIISNDSATALDTLVQEGNDAMAGLQISMQAPLGFGGGVVAERMVEQPSAAVTNPFGVIGAERKRTISQQKMPERRNKLLAELVDSSERDDAPFVATKQEVEVVGGLPIEQAPIPAANEHVDIPRSAGLGSGEVAEAMRSGGSLEEELTPPQAKSTPSQRPQVPTSSSWAKVANLAPSKRVRSTAAPSTAFSGHLLPANAVPSLALRPSRSASTGASNTAKTGDSIPHAASEPLMEQYRALYLGNLPTGTTLATISARITTGGRLLSLLLMQDASEALSGLSCCVIFQNAADCRTFMQENAPAGVEVVWPAAEGVPHSAKLFNSIATDGEIFIMPAGTYSDPDTKLMDLHPFPRRRVKFTKKGLFLDLSISTFKKDILSLIGGTEQHLEFWHFYNAGECTVVFASVRIAIAVQEAFELWSKGIPQAILKGKSNAIAMGISHEELQLRGRYADVQTTFAHDFNERPEHDQPLFTTFEWVDDEGFTGVGRSVEVGKGKVFREPGQRGYKSNGQASTGLWQGPPAAKS